MFHGAGLFTTHMEIEGSRTGDGGVRFRRFFSTRTLNIDRTLPPEGGISVAYFPYLPGASSRATYITGCVGMGNERGIVRAREYSDRV